jgi:hypothetical protein
LPKASVLERRSSIAYGSWQNAATRIEQHVADPSSLHHARLHRAPGLPDPACDFVHCLDDFRMIGLAGIAETLGKIVWANALQVDARH